MIQIEHLTFTYPGADQPVLKDVSLEIEQGEFLALIGNNGCGKSTLCKTVNGLIPHFIAGDYSGRVLVDREDTMSCSIGNLARKAGYVYQDFENQIVRPSVLDDASYACMNYAMPDYIDRGIEALTVCGLGHKQKDYIWQLSGGQKHLLALAGMTALSPDILILDEPIAQLDPVHAGQIYEILKDLNENYHKTIIVIEHHTEYIARYCSKVVLMKEGEIVWKLPTADALSRVRELVTCNVYPPQITMAADHLMNQGLLPNNSLLPVTLKDALPLFQEAKLLSNAKLRNPGIEASSDPGPSIKEKSNPLISFHNVSVEYRSVKGAAYKAFENLTLDIHKGEKIALIGSNGAGKSTLMKLMIGLLAPSQGDILLQGCSLKDLKQNQLSNLVSLVYQNPEEMFIKDSIQSDIEYAMKVRKVKDYRIRTEDLIQRFHLEEIKDRDGRLLSGGQMRRASLAIGIALNPALLLLDEPTANLDIATRKEIMRVLTDIKGITETVIIASHDMQLVCEWADRIIVLCAGDVIADGDRNSIFENPYVTEKIGILPPEIHQLGKLLQPGLHCYTTKEFLNFFYGEELKEVV